MKCARLWKILEMRATRNSMRIAIKIIVVKVTVKGVWCQCKRNLKVLMR